MKLYVLRLKDEVSSQWWKAGEPYVETVEVRETAKMYILRQTDAAFLYNYRIPKYFYRIGVTPAIAIDRYRDHLLSELSSLNQEESNIHIRKEWIKKTLTNLNQVALPEAGQDGDK